jgi:hypothetical protein
MFTPNVLGLAAGAALVELVDYRLVLAALGVALLATAAALLQSRASASHTSDRSPSETNPS